MRKLKIKWILLFFLACSESAYSQSLRQDTLFVPDQFRQYQFQLAEPVQSIEKLRYEKSDEPIKGLLSPDGKRVIMENYKKGQRVKLDVIYSNGRKEEISKSPCYIDPVSYEL